MLSRYVRALVIFFSGFALFVSSAANSEENPDGWAYYFQGCGLTSCPAPPQAGAAFKMVPGGAACVWPDVRQECFYNAVPCLNGDSWDQADQACVPPPPECAIGTYDPLTGGCNVGDSGDCQDIAGYILDGIAVCDDDKNECEASGGTLGAACMGADCQASIQCFPPGNEPDTCAGGGMVVLLEEGFICESPTDNQNGTNNEEGGDTSAGQDPNTQVNPENPENPNNPDPDPSTLTDQIQLQQEALGEAQENTKELRKQTNQLGDVNKELDNITKNTDRAADELEMQNTANQMPEHTVSNTVGDVVGNFWTGLQAAPIVQAAYGFGNVIPEGGVCTPLSVDLGPSIGFVSSNLFCELLDDYGQALGYIVLLCFAFASFRVFFSA